MLKGMILLDENSLGTEQIKSQILEEYEDILLKK